MVFSSPVFLFLFLPILMVVYALTPRVLKNAVLLAFSLLFYAWGEGAYTVIMLASIAFNYVAGLVIDRLRGRASGHRALALAVGVNLLLLGLFKYANFAADNLNVVLRLLHLPTFALAPIHLPIGISFFTFHAISYVVDVYRGEARVQRNPVNVALYVTLFPQLIAGPILRYHDLADQMGARTVTFDRFAYGVRRFVLGLGKKVLIANTLALPADQIFGLAPEHLGSGVAWLGLACYTLQIYFDFSGYSDMAVGLGHCFGFRIMENFRHPYAALSLRDFWRRWHISLSTFLRDYLYIPLGGSRCAPWRVTRNLLAVFLLCGLWHGASWTFVIWGGVHGAFLMVERLGLEARLARTPRLVQRLYLMALLALTWTLFRAESLTGAVHMLAALAGVTRGTMPHTAAMYASPLVWIMLAAGVIGSTPWLPHASAWLARARQARPPASAARIEALGAWGSALAIAAVFAASVLWLAAGTYNPFIYFRF